MSSFQCPYCLMIMSISNDTYSTRYPSFERTDGKYRDGAMQTRIVDSCVQMEFYKCPNCGKYTVQATGIGHLVQNLNKTNIVPRSLAKQYPRYIPENIRSDYEEACAIASLSPKASATLARRCLQGMIRDFWGISKSSLYQEIDAIKDKIPADLWFSIDALRQLGNIGAHMEKDTNVIIDIDSDEADSLIKLIELLMKEWYINREERKQLFSSIISTNNEKQNQRKKT